VNDLGLMIGIIGIILNLLVILIQAKVKGDMSELKAHIYQNFATKRDVYHMVKQNANHQ
jgi:hypothetical protein